MNPKTSCNLDCPPLRSLSQQYISPGTILSTDWPENPAWRNLPLLPTLMHSISVGKRGGMETVLTITPPDSFLGEFVQLRSRCKACSHRAVHLGHEPSRRYANAHQQTADMNTIRAAAIQIGYGPIVICAVVNSCSLAFARCLFDWSRAYLVLRPF